MQIRSNMQSLLSMDLKIFQLTKCSSYKNLNSSRPSSDKEKKLSQIFIFTHLCGVSKGFMKALTY